MAIIPLRAYNREIEGMVDNSQLDEAVAHCRYILATFPKYITAYRLMGKAYLELQRISDATDIFQRVLSSVPDDFIANAGMSIIREDENNLDSAIWHMELAYEAQPSNTAIQDELRRLYGRRDGSQPSKVRLTRGALARMYAKGGLFDQAIAELRAAISEEPNRPDLQLLLAEMYFQTSQRAEAVETCANLIKKMPYCLEANRILAISLPDADSSETVKNYRQVVIAMDPYYAYAGPESISSDQVPENAVNIERLDYKSGIQAVEPAVQPNWANSLGVSIDKPIDDNIPDWLKSAEAPPPIPAGEKAGSNVSPFIFDSQEAEKIITDTSKPGTEIPDWMKDAGWQPATGEAHEGPIEMASEEPGEETSSKEDLEKGEIPDWLKGIAPEGALGEAKPAEEPSESTLSTPWLEQHEPGPTDSIIHWLEDNKPEKPESRAAKEEISAELPEDEMPDWLKDLEPTQTPPSQTAPPSGPTSAFTIDASEFIGEGLDSEPNKTEPALSSSLAEETTQPPHPDETLPGLSPTGTGGEAEDEIPDWLKDLAGPPISDGDTPITHDVQPVEETTMSGQETPSGEPLAKETAQANGGETGAELPIAEETPPAEEMPMPPEPSIEETMIGVSESIPSGEGPSIKEQPTAEEEPGGPEVHMEYAQPVEEIPSQPESILPEEEQPEKQVPAVIEEVPTGEESIPTEIPSGPEAAPAEEIPSWLQDLAAAAPEITAEETVAEQMPVQKEKPTEVSPAEELPAWMEEIVPQEPTAPMETVSAEVQPEQAEIPGESEAVSAEELHAGAAVFVPAEPAAHEEKVTAEEQPAQVEEPSVPEAVSAEEQPTQVEEPSVPDAVPVEELPTWMEENVPGGPVSPIREITAELVPVHPEETAEAKPPEELPIQMEEIVSAEPSEPEQETPIEEVPVRSEEPPAPEAIHAEELPSWMQELTMEELSSIVKEPFPTEASASPEVSATTEITPPTEEQTTIETPAATETAVVKEVSEPEAEHVSPEQPPIEEKTIETGQASAAEGGLIPPEPGTSGELEAFAWLEGLAAEQSAKEEGMPAQQETGEISPPEWVKLEAEPPSDELIKPELKAAETKAVPEEEIPDWIKGLGEEPEGEPAKPEGEVAPVPTPELEPTQGDELPAWLRELEQPEAEKGESAQADEGLEWKPEELPAWLKEITEEEAPTEAATPAPPLSVEAPTVSAETPAIIEPSAVEATPLTEVTPAEPAIPTELPVPAEPTVAEEISPLEAPPTEERLPPVELLTPTEAKIPEPVTTEEIPTPEEVTAAEEFTPISLEPATQWSSEATPPAGILREALTETPVESVEGIQTEEEAAQPEAAGTPETAAPIEEEAAAPPVVAETAQPEELFETFQTVSKANQATLSDARQATSNGEVSKAIKLYNSLIRQNYHLDEIIQDLRDALYRFPVDVNMWVALGEAHFHTEDLQAALDAYNKADELVR